MSTRPRYHDLGAMDQVRGDEIRLTASALARILGAQSRHNEWRDRSCWSPPRRREPWRNGPRRLYSHHPRAGFPRTRGPRYWRPRYDVFARPGMTFDQARRSSHPYDWRFQVLPRRGPPVTAMKVPRDCRPEDPRKRQPRGSNPGGTLRGGPERPADDPRRNPRGGLCGGPGRSAKEPQAPSKINTRKNTNGGKAARREVKIPQRPTIITIEKSGLVRKWGPLSRANAWRAGCYWEEMGGDAKIYLEKGQKRTEVAVEMTVK